MQIDYQKESEILKALSNPIRLKIIDAIREREVCVSSLEEITGASQSCVSQHLSVLRNLGMVETSRNGNLICYSLNNRLAERIVNSIYEEYKSD
ncbi:MAG: metalloregulator ArsR/SmtB family transcription factor [Candidatus Marinimicrobia bacterium]|nr:metalloregulator ArsR/SmtB family transcription factor [Candidatus Neomarinimicrobiota bacterium]MCF7828136.1 metalloregulator ArsR/SmtB family transcription factor [Candidatus Neomarinimicrobiota bacterium]MCF7879689.1 metalloregulator ArsR/SmtB family transcription factor [Candidatus Neomarinimicrobiota bacterium]